MIKEYMNFKIKSDATLVCKDVNYEKITSRGINDHLQSVIHVSVAKVDNKIKYKNIYLKQIREDYLSWVVLLSDNV